MGEDDVVVRCFELCRIKLLNAAHTTNLHTHMHWPLIHCKGRETSAHADEMYRDKQRGKEKENRIRSITQNKWLLNAIIHYQEYENEVKEERGRDIHVERFRLLIIIVNCFAVTAFSICVD